MGRRLDDEDGEMLGRYLLDWKLGTEELRTPDLYNPLAAQFNQIGNQDPKQGKAAQDIKDFVAIALSGGASRQSRMGHGASGSPARRSPSVNDFSCSRRGYSVTRVKNRLIFSGIEKRDVRDGNVGDWGLVWVRSRRLANLFLEAR